MKSKEIWTIVMIALIVSVLSSVITIMMMKDVSFSPRPTLQPANVPSANPLNNAKACNADGVCETNDLKASGNAFVGNPSEVIASAHGNLFVENDLIAGGSFSQDCKTFQFTVLQDFTGDQVCQQEGYDYCLVGDTTYNQVIYYDSTDGSCSGDIQLTIRQNRLSSCPVNTGGEGGSPCLQSPTNTNEPAFGDYRESGGDTSGRILCCR